MDHEEVWLREYEFTYIIKATETDEAIEANIDEFQTIATGLGAEIINVDRWGRRKLAYDINKQREGFYVFMHMKAEREAIAELERQSRLREPIVRFLTVRVDDEMQRAARRATIRARRKGIDPAELIALETARRGERAGSERRPRGDGDDRGRDYRDRDEGRRDYRDRDEGRRDYRDRDRDGWAPENPPPRNRPAASPAEDDSQTDADEVSE